MTSGLSVFSSRRSGALPFILRTEFEQLLGRCKKAIDANSPDAKRNVQEQLLAFIKESPQRCSFLDDIANKAAHDLFLNTADAWLQAIASRNAELQQATEIISGVTIEAKSDAKSPLMTDITSSLDKITAGLGKLHAAANGEQNLLDKIKGIKDGHSRRNLRSI